MKIDYKDFIGIYSDVFPKGYCPFVISEFERLVEIGAGSDRQTSEGSLKHTKDDMQLIMDYYPYLQFNSISILNIFNGGLQACYDEYTNKYSVLKDSSIRSSYMKIQRTNPGGGYHVWHSEQGNFPHSNRVLVYILYLNTLPEESAGETEFLYIQRRIRPIENTLLIWPASYTHAHRGNTVFSNINKYIVTGWFNYE